MAFRHGIRDRERVQDDRTDAQSRRPPVAPLLAFGLIPLTTYSMTTVGATLLEHTAPMTYYQTVAFLIPSLLVTLALQGQFFRIQHAVPPSRQLVDRHPRVARAWIAGQRVAAVAMLGYLASGELASLYVLAVQQSAPLLFGVTAGAVVTAFVAVGIIALVGTPWKQ